MVSGVKRCTEIEGNDDVNVNISSSAIFLNRCRLVKLSCLVLFNHVSSGVHFFRALPHICRAKSIQPPPKMARTPMFSLPCDGTQGAIQVMYYYYYFRPRCSIPRGQGIKTTLSNTRKVQKSS